MEDKNFKAPEQGMKVKREYEEPMHTAKATGEKPLPEGPMRQEATPKQTEAPVKTVTVKFVKLSLDTFNKLLRLASEKIVWAELDPIQQAIMKETVVSSEEIEVKA